MFEIITDTSANLDCEWLEIHRVKVVPFHYYSAGADQICTDTRRFDGAAFYDAMRSGTRITTSQISPQDFESCFRPLLLAGNDLLFISMSSGISGSFHQASFAAEELRKEFPDRKILLVDTLSASLGEGLLVIQAVSERENGCPLDDVYRRLLETRMAMCQIFTVDDLKYLRATGRLSNAAALVGSLLGIKPLLKGNEEGKIVSFSRLRGRKKAIAAMAAEYDRLVRNPDSQLIGIAHADCAEDAEALAALLRRNHPPREILTVMYEPVTGSHVGPGTLALFFLGDLSFRGEKNMLAQLTEDKRDQLLAALHSRMGQKSEE